MLALHHWPFDPFSRQVRVALAEKRAEAHLIEVDVFDPDPAFLALAAGAHVPVLVDDTGGQLLVITDARAAIEYLEDLVPTPALLPGGPAERATARALAHQIDLRFDFEVNALILHEKLEKRLGRLGAPDPSVLRRGKDALRARLEALEPLAAAHGYLAGDRFTAADVAAACHLSTLDYVEAVAWDDFPAVRAWYAKVKSRPSFRALLADVAPGMPAPPHYADLDF